MTKKSNYPSVKAHRERKLAAGICWDCKQPAEPGSRYCVYHQDDRRQQNRNWRAKKKGAPK